jgi:hypothetical protein
MPAKAGIHQSEASEASRKHDPIDTGSAAGMTGFEVEGFQETC